MKGVKEGWIHESKLILYLGSYLPLDLRMILQRSTYHLLEQIITVTTHPLDIHMIVILLNISAIIFKS